VSKINIVDLAGCERAVFDYIFFCVFLSHFLFYPKSFGASEKKSFDEMRNINKRYFCLFVLMKISVFQPLEIVLLP
jgi:hypothetical protein